MPSSPRGSRLLLAALALGASSPALACSPAPPSPYRTIADFHFLGLALGDSVRAGHGSIHPETWRGFFGRLFGRRVYGQRFAVERIGKPWQSQLPPGTKSVILVAWSMDDANCRSLYRRGSAVWMTPGTQAVYRGALRAKSQWVQGVPTFDVVGQAPYTARFRPRTRADSARRLFTPNDYLGFIEALPRDDSLAMNPARANVPLNQWIAEHPDFATAYPAEGIIKVGRDVLERRKGK